MLFFKKTQKKMKDVVKWYPSLITVGKVAGTQEIAERLARESTLSPADVHAVIRALPIVMADIMAESRSVNLEGLGSFRYSVSASGNGAETADKVNSAQIKSVRVQFTPARQKQGTTYSRSLVGNLSFTHWQGKEKPEEGGGEEKPDEL